MGFDNRWLCRWFCVLVCAPLAGCGKDEITLIPISGTLTVEGQPLANAGVSFQADSEKGNTTRHVPTGLTDAQGKYELMTTLRKGAPPGWYKVVILPPAPVPTGGDLPLVKDFPYARKYADRKTTELRVEVKTGVEPKQYDFSLPRK